MNDLKISLENLRDRINLEKDYWENMSNTNCYAYALGLDIAEKDIIEKAYHPGVMANSPIKLPDFFAYDDLITNVFLDLEALKINYREVGWDTKINDDEWKIALMVAKYQEDKYFDFHFLRQRKDGFWYHKIGYSGLITRHDSKGIIIDNPQDCCIYNETYDRCLSLSLK